MNINISNDASELGNRAAQFASIKLCEAIRRTGEARLLVSTGKNGKGWKFFILMNI